MEELIDTFDDIVSTLKNHFEPKPARNCGTFGSDETVAQYVEELRTLSTNCNYIIIVDAALRDRFVCGLKSETFQKNLLTEANLTFGGAVFQACLEWQSCFLSFPLTL